MMKMFVRTMAGWLVLFGFREPDSCGDQLIVTTLSGATIDKIDQTSLNITVRTDGCPGKLSMPVVNSPVIKGIKPGDRVSLKLNPQGRVVKIRKLTPILMEGPDHTLD